MAAKNQFSLNPNPTFPATVLIPLPGADSQPLQFTFKHMGRLQFAEFIKSLDAARVSDVEVQTLESVSAEVGLNADVGFIMEVVGGWALQDEFNEANLRILLDSYYGASRAILSTFIEALTVAKAKN